MRAALESACWLCLRRRHRCVVCSTFVCLAVLRMMRLSTCGALHAQEYTVASAALLPPHDLSQSQLHPACLKHWREFATYVLMVTVNTFCQSMCASGGRYRWEHKV